MAKTSFKRNAATRNVGKKILIACEGKCTEHIYLSAIRQDIRLPKERINILPCGYRTDPLSIVQKVIDEKNHLKHERRWETTDSAWAVFDGDEHIESSLTNWEKAIHIAKNQIINLAITNPSIEFWYLIHFQDHSASISQDKARERLNKHIPNYDKARCYYQEKLKGATQDAIARATKLDELAKRNNLPEYSNPCCGGISKLVEMLLKLGDR